MEEDREASLRGQAEIVKYTLGYVDSMAVKCAVELGIPDIINSHGHPMTLSQIAAGISDAPSPDIPWLGRIMRLLVRRNVFAVHVPSDGGAGGVEEPLYGLTHSSRCLVRSATSTPCLAPLVLMGTHPVMVAPWHRLSECVRHGGTAFRRAHGKELYEFASEDGEFNKIFNEGLGCTAGSVTEIILEVYREGFGGLSSLVDVGGGIGGVLSEIVKSHPQIEGINFDLPHVVATAPVIPGVRHVGGDMFESLPNADAVLVRWVMHNWSDEDCVKILKNCRRAIPKERGKVIIVDEILDPHGDTVFDDITVSMDLVMGSQTKGKERSEIQWKKLLTEAGFSRFDIIKFRALHFNSIIQAYPD